MISKIRTLIAGAIKLNFTPFLLGLGAVAVLTTILLLLRTKPPVIIHEPGGTTVVQVDKPSIQYKDVIKYVKDEKEVAVFMAEIAALKIKLSQFTESTGTSTTSGTGTITPTTPVVPSGNGVAQAPAPFTFSDWRLNLESKDGKAATYSLSQQFEVLTTSGVAADGHKTASVKLFEIGPGETRTPIPVQTTVVTTAPPSQHLSVGLTISGGFGLTSGAGRAIIAGIPWLKRQSTPAPKDQTLAFLTPVMMVGAVPGQRVLDVGILPISWNFGSLKGNPLSNIWLSPLVSYNKGRIGIGGAITANF